MVTDASVRLLRKKMAEGKTVMAAAAAAGMGERSAYIWKRTGLPGDTKKKRSWRTRPDPFDEVWDTELVPVLKANEHGVMEATTLRGRASSPANPIKMAASRRVMTR